MDQSILVNISIVSVLILLNAFFVASEFSIVKVRKTRLEQLANEGSSSATDIIVPTLIATFASTLAGVLLVKIFSKIFKDKQ